jgi:hypothetical protein
MADPILLIYADAWLRLEKKPAGRSKDGVQFTAGQTLVQPELNGGGNVTCCQYTETKIHLHRNLLHKTLTFPQWHVERDRKTPCISQPFKSRIWNPCPCKTAATSSHLTIGL